MRLDLALIAANPGLSRRAARAAIEKGQVLVRGQVSMEAGLDVAGPADVAWERDRPARRRVRCSLPLLHVDDALVVVDKPAGLLSVPTHPGSTEDTVLVRVKEMARHVNPRHPFAAAGHRLDKDTSGALAVALSPRARDGLRALFRAHAADRRYLALVDGTPPADHGVIDEPVTDAYVGGRRAVARPGEASRPALTRWRVRERLPGAALLEVALGTGRQHQIRIHLSHVGLPILGDVTYGPAHRRRGLVVPRQMLHAAHLAFRHPLTGEDVRVESPLPADFQTVIRALRTPRR